MMERSAMSKGEQGRAMGRIIARAWSDAAFKERLLADATAVLREEGVAVPEGLVVKAGENTGKVFHLVLPRMSDARPLRDEEAARAAYPSDCSHRSDISGARRGDGQRPGRPRA